MRDNKASVVNFSLRTSNRLSRPLESMHWFAAAAVTVFVAEMILLLFPKDLQGNSNLWDVVLDLAIVFLFTLPIMLRFFLMPLWNLLQTKKRLENHLTQLDQAVEADIPQDQLRESAAWTGPDRNVRLEMHHRMAQLLTEGDREMAGIINGLMPGMAVISDRPSCQAAQRFG